MMHKIVCRKRKAITAKNPKSILHSVEWIPDGEMFFRFTVLHTGKQ